MTGASPPSMLVRSRCVEIVIVLWFVGDYTLLEKLFGQTSNNKARMDLKAQVLAKVNIPTDPEQVSALNLS